MKTTYPVKVSPQGQITLPKALRDELRVQKGKTRLYVKLEDNKLSVNDDPPILKYYGILKPKKGEKSAADYLAEMKLQQRRKTEQRFGL